MTEGNNTQHRRTRLVLHPFFIAIYLVLAPLAQNIGTVGLQAIRALLTVLLIVILGNLTLSLLMRQKRKAGLVATAVILFVGLYGHVSEFLGSLLPVSQTGEILLLMLWGLLALAAQYSILYKLADPEPWHLYFNVVGGVLLLFPLYNILTFSRAAPAVADKGSQFHQDILRENGLLDLESTWSADGEPRDIFYLILDGYAREDVLRELYSYDNSAFVMALETRGFQVADEATANYGSTTYSIASTLNMVHIDQAPSILATVPSSDANSLLINGLRESIRQNKLSDLLQNQGYQIIAFDSGYGGAQISNADIQAQSPDIAEVNTQAAFELLLVDSSIGRILLKLRGEDFSPLGALFDDHRTRVRYGIQHLSDYAGAPEPQFVFSHVISPHYPYVFGPNGEPRYAAEPFSLLDQEGFGQWKANLYTDQVAYINSLVLTEIDEILAANDPDPIIVIHADHGSRSWADPDPVPALRRKLLFPVLAAVYFPDRANEITIPMDLNLVNLNRLLLNAYFGTRLSMQPHSQFLLQSDGGLPRFVEACVVLGDC